MPLQDQQQRLTQRFIQLCSLLIKQTAFPLQQIKASAVCCRRWGGAIVLFCTGVKITGLGFQGGAAAQNGPGCRRSDVRAGCILFRFPDPLCKVGNRILQPHLFDQIGRILPQGLQQRQQYSWICTRRYPG